MATWAGVQKASRPIERCQAMSQWAPAIAEVTAMTEHQMYQGTGARFTMTPLFHAGVKNKSKDKRQRAKGKSLTAIALQAKRDFESGSSDGCGSRQTDFCLLTFTLCLLICFC